MWLWKTWLMDIWKSLVLPQSDCVRFQKEILMSWTKKESQLSFVVMSHSYIGLSNITKKEYVRKSMLFLIWPFGPLFFFHMYYHFDCETCFYCEKLIFEKMKSPLILFILKGENKIRKKKSCVTSYLEKTQVYD